MNKYYIQHPGIIMKEVFTDLKNDLLSHLKYYSYPHPTIFIAGGSKSGSTWLMNLLAQIPGYNVRPVTKLHWNSFFFDGVSDKTFNVKGYTVIRLHTKYSQENLEIIRKHVKKFLVIYRDLRNVVLSYYGGVKRNVNLEYHAEYNEWSFDRGFSHMLDRAEPFISWTRDWVSAKDEDILFVKFEDLCKDTIGTLETVTKFFNMGLSRDYVHKLVLPILKKPECSIQARGRLSTSVGGGSNWEKQYSPMHKEKFKEIAGNLLIELGYERGNNW